MRVARGVGALQPLMAWGERSNQFEHPFNHKVGGGRHGDATSSLMCNSNAGADGKGT
jgi:hypothetical protein